MAQRGNKAYLEAWISPRKKFFSALEHARKFASQGLRAHKWHREVQSSLQEERSARTAGAVTNRSAARQGGAGMLEKGILRGWILSGSMLFCLVLPWRVSAAIGDCTTSSINHGNTNGQKQYRVNSASFDLIPTVTRDGGANAVGMGADRWNEQANAGHFVLGPSTSLTDIPLYKDLCEQEGKNFSLVVVLDISNPNNAYAQAEGRCLNGGKFTQFRIVIFTKNSSGTQWPWAAGDIGTGQLDLASVMTHEFGHTMRLGHPGSGEASVMGPIGTGTTLHRDLYQWDLKCARQISGHRALTAYRRSQSSGTLGSEAQFTTTWPVAKVSAGRTKYTGSLRWAAALTLDAGIIWTMDLDQSNSNYIGADVRVGIGPTESTWRENESIDRVLYGSYEEYQGVNPVPWQWASKHILKTSRSNNGFYNYTPGTLSHCTEMTGWMTCSNYQPVYTGKAPAVA